MYVLRIVAAETGQAHVRKLRTCRTGKEEAEFGQREHADCLEVRATVLAEFRRAFREVRIRNQREQIRILENEETADLSDDLKQCLLAFSRAMLETLDAYAKVRTV